MGDHFATKKRHVLTIAALALAGMMALQLTLPTTAVTASSDVTWTETTLLSGDKYQNVDIEIGKRHIYVMTWEYYTGPVVMLQRSDCWGQEWSTPTDVFGEGLWNAFPAMCCYTNGTQDELLIAAGSDIVSKSFDSGETFERLAPLPIPDGCQDWRYMAVGTNASWFGGAVDSDIYILGSLYVGVFPAGTHKIAFTKSTDWGYTWNEPVFLCPDEVKQTNYPEVISDGSRLYVAYTKINVTLEGSQTALKWSDDWGATWSDEVPMPVSTPLGVAATGFQYVDDERAILTVSTNSHDPVECTGKIGYFHFSDCTYEILYEMSGPEWCMAAGTFEGELAKNGVYHIAWAHEPVLSEAMSLKYAWSKDVPFTDMQWQTPLMMGNPPPEPGESGSYDVALHGTDSDSGEGTWGLRSNGDWLHQVVSSDGSCEVTGTPTEVGEFWVNVTVQDDDSSDYFNWTVAVTQAFPDGDEDDDTDDDDASDEPTDEPIDEPTDEPVDEPADEELEGDDDTTITSSIEGWMLALAAVACGAVVVAALMFTRRKV